MAIGTKMVTLWKSSQLAFITMMMLMMLTDSVRKYILVCFKGELYLYFELLMAKGVSKVRRPYYEIFRGQCQC